MSQHKDTKTGKWYYTGKYRDLMGNRHDYKKRGFRTKKEAKEAEEAFLLKIKGGQGRIKMDALIKLYHQEMASVIKQSTLTNYKQMERLYIIPYFGNKYIDTIKTTEITKWNKEVSLSGLKGKALSQRYTNNLYLHMSGLLTFAVNHKLLNDNPCKYARPYKNPNTVEQKENSTDNFWEVEEYNKFIATATDINYKDIYETLFLMGLRIGELQALRWSNIDFKNNKLNVKGTYNKLTHTVTSPKTKKSNRTIDIPKRLAEELKDRYARNSKQDGFTEEYFVFGDLRPIDVSTLRLHFSNQIERAKVKKITLHGLRHSHASFLLSNPNISEALVAERMGHSIDMLRNTYAHIYENRRTALVQYIENL